MIPIIAFVGEKKSGKTKILVKVIKILTKRGRKVGIIKHTVHGFQLDHPKTDTYLLYKAGAQMVAIASEEEIGFYGKPGVELNPEAVRDLFLPPLDLILTEGFKQSPLPKVLVANQSPIPAWAKNLSNLIAVISKAKPDLEVKSFKPNQIEKLADFLDRYIKAQRPVREVKIYLDGKKLPLKPFIKDFFLHTISAMVSSLKHSKATKRIQITIDLPLLSKNR